MSSNNIPPTILLLEAYAENKICAALRWKHFFTFASIIDALFLLCFAGYYAYGVIACSDSETWWKIVNIGLEWNLIAFCSVIANLYFVPSDPPKVCVLRTKWHKFLFLITSAITGIMSETCGQIVLPMIISVAFFTSRCGVLLLAYARQYASENEASPEDPHPEIFGGVYTNE
jgi:hypothetical protein